MPLKNIYGLLVTFCLLVGSVDLSSAQEKTSPFIRYSVDISYGVPFYQGDFDSFISTPLPYDGVNLSEYIQYNQSSIAGSFTVPWKYGLSFKLKATQSIVYYSEQIARVNFKNSMYDISLLTQYQLSVSRFNSYLYFGVGYHVSSDAQVFRTVAETKQNSNFGYIERLSSTAGFGLEFLVWRNFSVFTEADLYLTGSDRFDGYNGLSQGFTEQPKEKKYFARDKLVTFRGGIRVYFLGSSKLIAERPFNKASSSFYENPYTDTTKTNDKKKEDELPEELKKLGVQRKLVGYTLEVNRVITIDELKRQKDAGEKVIGQIRRHFPDAKVELLLETIGFTIHIGGFKSDKEAKEALFTVRQFYSGATVLRH